MKSSKHTYFAVVEGDALAPGPRELLSAAVLEYEEFILVGNNERLLNDLSRYVHATIAARPICVLASSNALLLTVEHFLDHAYLHEDASRRFFKVCLDTGEVTLVPQVRDASFKTDANLHVYYEPGMQGLHPVVKSVVEAACAQHNEVTRLVCRLLIGYSFLPDQQLKSKSAGSDLDALQLHELQAFLGHLAGLVPNFTLLQEELTDLITHCNTLLAVCPSSASDLANIQATAALQNGFPCIYKVMSVLHYLAYQLAIERNLFSKAFMHIFRAYECYTSGALFLDNATIRLHTKSGTSLDSYMINNQRILGFTPVFKGIGTYFNLEQNTDYLTCKFYIDLRNKFHYTHGDVKPSASLANEFARAVIRQILKIEKAANQQNFLWRDVYMQTRKHLVKDPQWQVPAAIRRALQAHQLTSFMVP
ncbi:hypothetical protein LOY46_03525 [Pseudomonas sichuanensis]|uniref:hypothetical protein n=1 Tax=Pseudomonas sichuanensis TaxID=2213015 RepID=UPI00215DF6F8|nr:hypothetical protein [Pseudomonas sichuanensis]UVK83795.1 hypothetical protein LOY46_03525 [Pseudomonas sichuanensis]